MSPRSIVPQWFARASRLLVLMIGLAVAATWINAPLLAQTCTTDDPPCPPPPLISVSMAPRITSEQAQTRIGFSVTNVRVGGTVSVSATLNGSAVTPTFVPDASGYSGSGEVPVTLVSGDNTVTVTVSDGIYADVASSTVTYNYVPPLQAQGVPIVTVDPVAPYRRSVLGCAGCAYSTLSYSTPAYHSLDQDRALTLAYSSAMSAPKGFVSLDVNPNSTTLPARVSIALIGSGGTAIPLEPGGNEAVFRTTPLSPVLRVTAQFDASGYATGTYDMTAVVQNRWDDGGSTETRVPVRVLIINERNSSFGSGWTVAGLQHLHLSASGHLAVVDGGSITVFPSCGSGCWTTPPGEETSLVAGASGTYQRRYRNGSVLTFSSNGLMTQSANRLGLATNYSYDGYGRLIQVTDPGGFVTTVSWSGAPGGNLFAYVTTPGGRTSRIQTDGAGQLIDILDPDNVRALFVSYSGNRVVTAIDRIGVSTDFAYDQYGGLATATGPWTDTNDRGWSRSSTTYASRESALLPRAGTGTDASPADAVLAGLAWLRIRSQRGDSVRITSNEAGDPLVTETRNSLGKLESTTIGYNANGQPVRVTSTRGTNMWYGWNGASLDTVIDNAAGINTWYNRNPFGDPYNIYVNGVMQEGNTYYANGLLQYSTRGNATSQFTYDGAGRVLTATDGEGHTTTLTYQTTGFLNVATATKDGRTTQYGYDGYGRPTAVTDATGRTDSTQFDVVNRVSRTVAPNNAASTWGYDDISRIYTFTDAKLQQYQTTLNEVGAPKLSYDALGLRQSNTYDSDGNVHSTSSRGGRTIVVTRDQAGRPTQMSAGGLTTTISYDTVSKWMAYANGESIDTVYYDGDGRVAKQVAVRNGTAFTMTANYGDQGERQSLTVAIPIAGSNPIVSSLHWFNLHVDSLGRLDKLWDPSGKGTAITYNRDQQAQTITFPTGMPLRQSFTYGNNDRLTDVSTNFAADVLRRRYSYDAVGKMSTSERGNYPNSTVRTTDYDAIGRLSHWSDVQYSEGSPVWICDDPRDELSCYNYYPTDATTLRDQTYTYDAVGNRTDLGAVVGSGNRLTSFNGYTLTYDGDGNLLTKSGNGLNQSFVWNGFGQLESVTTNGVVTSFGYDGMGRRVRKTSSGVTTFYLYDGDNLIMQLDGTGRPQLEFSYYPYIDNLHAVRNSSTGAVYYYLKGPSGSVTALVDQNNQVVNRYDYAPFGSTITATEQLAQPFRFASRQLDIETGLYYNRARYYDAELGRFISEDPVGLAGGTNRYVYASNDPVNHRDAYGLDDCFEEVLRSIPEETYYADPERAKAYAAKVCFGGQTPIYEVVEQRTPPPVMFMGISAAALTIAGPTFGAGEWHELEAGGQRGTYVKLGLGLGYGNAVGGELGVLADRTELQKNNLTVCSQFTFTSLASPCVVIGPNNLVGASLGRGVGDAFYVEPLSKTWLLPHPIDVFMQSTFMLEARNYFGNFYSAH